MTVPGDSRKPSHRLTAEVLTFYWIFPLLTLTALTRSQKPSMEVVPPSSNVVELNIWTFRGSIGDGRMWFVEFYVPWCRGCKRMAAQFEELGQTFQDNRDVVVARFDCMQDEAMCERLGIDRTPTLKLYVDGKDVETYKADFYHVDLMKPFLVRMYDQHMAGKAGRRKDTPQPPQPPQTQQPQQKEEQQQEQPVTASNDSAGRTASGRDARGRRLSAAASAPANSADAEAASSPDVIRSSPVVPGEYDKPAGVTVADHVRDGEAEIIYQSPATDACGDGGGALGAAGLSPTAGQPTKSAPDGGQRAEAASAAAAAASAVSGASERPTGVDEAPLTRRGRHGGPAVEMLQRDKEEL